MKEMLEFNFFNVGDGDAALLSLKRENKEDFNVLIDTGRPELDPNESSLRAHATEHLKESGIDHLDVIIITHLHIDHMGAAPSILKMFPPKRFIVPYIPKGKIASFPRLTAEDPRAHKWPEFCNVLSIWEESLELAKKLGCKIENAWDYPVIEEDGLRIEHILAPGGFKKQKEFYDSLFGTNGEAKDNSERIVYPDWRDVSESKNPDSTMQLVSFAGKQFLFCGDRYAETFENWTKGECILIKLPHHGDPRSLTPKLLKALNPEYAVISCQLDPRRNKDRPNNEIIEMLKENGTKVFCTENRRLPSLEPSTNRKILIRLKDDGKIEM